jgi:Zn-dependent M16 (insulinase) family peptidase
MPFQLTKELKLPEINAILREWKHDCGAEVMHIETDDPENVFAIALRTWPSTSNGVAHVLEHTVLCGSKKYPVKDPFFAMQRRSLNTFLNAFTGSDFTCYPAASQNEKDFYNLFDVYIDAVFSPLLEKTRFQQEGIRLEFEKDKLTYKGIVFNEMKGALNSSHARMGESMLRELFPETIYGINSGGDPKHISKLTHDDLKAFHKEYYVPSRAVYYFYGNFPYQKHLDFLEERLLKEEEKTPPLPYPKRVERFKSPKKLEDFYPAHASENNPTLVSIGWITCPIENQLDSLALACLALILMDTDASLLKKVILKKGLAK